MLYLKPTKRTNDQCSYKENDHFNYIQGSKYLSHSLLWQLKACSHTFPHQPYSKKADLATVLHTKISSHRCFTLIGIVLLSLSPCKITLLSRSFHTIIVLGIPPQCLGLAYFPLLHVLKQCGFLSIVFKLNANRTVGTSMQIQPCEFGYLEHYMQKIALR